MKIVAFVPVKLDSERLSHKNMLPLGEHSLCWYVFNELLKCKNIDEIYAFCSSEQLLDLIPNNQKIKFIKRDSYLDSKDIKTQELYESFIKEIDADVYVAVSTTSPFISYESIDGGIDKVVNEDYDSAYTVKKIQTYSWYKDKPINYDPESIDRTQDIEPIYVETSGYFIFKKEVWNKYKRRIGFKSYKYELNEIETIDIDTKQDYEFACKVLGVIDKKGG